MQQIQIRKSQAVTVGIALVAMALLAVIMTTDMFSGLASSANPAINEERPERISVRYQGERVGYVNSVDLEDREKNYPFKVYDFETGDVIGHMKGHFTPLGENPKNLPVVTVSEYDDDKLIVERTLEEVWADGELVDTIETVVCSSDSEVRESINYSVPECDRAAPLAE